MKVYVNIFLAIFLFIIMQYETIGVDIKDS